MVDIIREDETLPDYPAPPEGLSAAATALDEDALWPRIEQWIIYRWPVRSVEWITEGAGCFVPRLQPAELVSVERWEGDWIEVQPDTAPLGLMLTSGTHRLVYNVGEAEPPKTVAEAYRRLAEYLTEVGTEAAGATSITDGDYSVTRSANAVARAMQYSGAADLLRRYR